jgi:hypothetical protein
MNKNWVSIILIILFIGITCSFLLLKNELAKGKSYTRQLEGQLNGLKSDTVRIQNERWVNILSIRENGKKLPPLDLIKDGNEASFLQSKNRTPKLIVRFSYLGCDVCVDSTIALLKYFEKSIGQDNILIWATYDNEANMKFFKNANRIHYPIYLVRENEKVLDADIYTIPYLFILTPHSGQINDLFFPLKENMNRTYQYLSIVSDKYFKN